MSTFEKDSACSDKDVTGQYSTMNIAIEAIKTGVESLAIVIEESTSNVMGDLIEPLGMFQTNY